MCIINSTYKFVFVHVPKCAGTTLSARFAVYNRYCDIELGATELGEAMQEPYYRRYGLRKHSPARTIKSVMGPSLYSSYFTFAFVRDPLTRIVSTYHFLKFDYREWPGSSVMERFRSLSDFIGSSYWEDEPGPDNLFMEQAFWLTDEPKGKDLIVDCVGRLETYDSSVATIVSRAKLPIVDKTSEHFDAIKNLGRANESTYGVSRTYRRSASLLRRLFGTTYDPVAVVKDKIRLPDKDRERIARRYALDYELFDYALPHGEAVLHL